jgi:integrase
MRITRFMLYARTCSAISVPTCLSVFIWKCVRSSWPCGVAKGRAIFCACLGPPTKVRTFGFANPRGAGRVAMPAGAPLTALLDATERRAPLILTNTRGRPWTSDGFRTSWSKACDRAGVSDLTFHDLRGTAVGRLAIGGASVPQIAAVTGHALKDVEAILDAHYLGRDIQLAEAAVLKLEARTKL